MTAFRKSNSSSVVDFRVILGLFTAVLGVFVLSVEVFTLCCPVSVVVVVLLLDGCFWVSCVREMGFLPLKSMLEVVFVSIGCIGCCAAFCLLFCFSNAATMHAQITRSIFIIVPIVYSLCSKLRLTLSIPFICLNLSIMAFSESASCT